MKITVVGLGYVGISTAVLLAQSNQVIGFDIDINKIELINKHISPIQDQLIQDFLQSNLNLIATNNPKIAYQEADIIFISLPTNFNEQTNSFDTLIIDSTIDLILQYNTNAIIVIKSTVPIGYTSSLIEKFQYNKIIFCPEFLREGTALWDLLNPDRVIYGFNCDLNNIKQIESLFSFKSNPQILYMTPSEAEAVKLFANTYLAMRVAFFNEVDNYALGNNLNTSQIIAGICSDHRIGSDYNNPSFGYGGYCLPKDSKQLLANFQNIPQHLITATVASNQSRKDYLFNQIISKSKPDTVFGIYRLNMKTNSDNCRSSASYNIWSQLKNAGFKVLVYEPLIPESVDLETLKTQSDIIIANRYDDKISDVQEKVFTRDIFHIN